MTVNEIKTAVDSGKRVMVGNSNYHVVKDALGQYLIECTANWYCIGLTWRDGVTLNGSPEDFRILESEGH